MSGVGTAAFIVLVQAFAHGPVILQYVGTANGVEACERGAKILNSSPQFMNREMIERGIGHVCVVPTVPFTLDEKKFKDEAERQLREALGLKEG